MSEERGLDEVAGDIIGLAARLASSLCRWLELVAEFDRREGWRPSGCHSCAHWLSWKCGIALQTAREQVRVGRALEALPLVRDAFAEGSLSYTKVRALVRMCTPATEADLVELAKVATGEHLNRIAAGYRTATKGPEDDTPRQSLRWQWDDDGQLRVSATLDAEAGRAFLTAMHEAARLVNARPGSSDAAAAACADHGERPVDHTGDGDGNLRLDADEVRQAGLVAAFVGMVQLALAAAADESASPPPPDLVVAVSVHDLQDDGRATRAGDRTEHRPDCACSVTDSACSVADPACSVADADSACSVTDGEHARPTRGRRRQRGLGRTLPRHRRQRFRLRAPSRTVDRRVAQRLACDATLTTLLHDSRGTPIDLGRRQRTVNHALRTALHLRDGGCRFPGCGHTRFVHAHHVVHWAHGGPTSLDNLLTLCTFHHRVVHEHDLSVAYSLDGTLRFVDRKGAEFAADRVESGGTCRRAGCSLPPASGSIEPTWGGERLDLALAIDAILSAEAVAERRSRQVLEHAAAAASPAPPSPAPPST